MKKNSVPEFPANEVMLIDPFDAHVHFRQGLYLPFFLMDTINQFAYGLGMPNTQPPILTAKDFKRYRDEILRLRDGMLGIKVSFEPVLPIQITPKTTVAMIRAAYRAGVRAGKFYPYRVTTNSETGIQDYYALWLIFAEMERLGMRALFHPEDPDPSVEGMHKEASFLRILTDISEAFPDLPIVVEHATTKEAISWVKRHYRMGRRVAATITIHHMLITLDNVIGYSPDENFKGAPDHICKPTAKFERDRKALVAAAVSGMPCFFYGGDSAPHPRDSKYAAEACCGVFNAPVATPLLIELFEREGKLFRLQEFISDFGRDFYDLPSLGREVRYIRQEWIVPQTYYEEFTPFRAGRTIGWSLATAQ